MLVTPATPKTEAGGLLEPSSSRPAWATEQDENRENQSRGRDGSDGAEQGRERVT